MNNNTWDLTKIYKTEKDFYDDIDSNKKLIEELKKYKGKILENSYSLYNVLSLQEKASLICEKLYVYAHLNYYSDMSNNKYNEYKESAIKAYDYYNEQTVFIEPELLKADYNNIKKLISENKDLSRYEFDLEKQFRYKKYTLSEKEEKILASASNLFRTSSDAYSELNNTDIKFDKIKDENGNLVELTSSNYSKYIKSNSKKVRKSTFDSMYKFYGEHINTISSLYASLVKECSFSSSVRGFNSSLEASLYSDNINVLLYKTLIKVTNNNLDKEKRFYELKKKVLGIKDFHMYDTYLNISSEVKKDIPYEEGKKIILEALKPLGEDYQEKLEYLFNNRCIDVYSRKNKRSGAYQWGTYGIDPYVSLNYENNIESVSEATHELGHAMHTHYSDNNQSFIDSEYPIFLAEIASTVNEVILTEYLYKKASNKDEKINYLNDFLDKAKATIFRQVMFAEFESTIHDKYKDGEAITKDLLCNTYLDLINKHFSPTVIVDEEIKYEWARIPHFYTPFYVYKYATGFISAIIIASKVLNNETEFIKKYKDFLMSGCSDYPLNLLNKLGIDMTNEKTIEEAFNYFDEKLSELEKLINEKE